MKEVVLLLICILKRKWSASFTNYVGNETAKPHGIQVKFLGHC